VRGGAEDGAEPELRLGFTDPALAGKIGNRHVAPERGRAGARSFKRRFADWFRRGDVLIAVGEGLWERATRTSPPVRLRRHTDRGVKVPFLAVSSREVSNRNCVVATQGGEQWNENRQSVTGGTVKGTQRELDSVGRAVDEPSGDVAKSVSAGKTCWHPGDPRTGR
jgi:hypothetical protein